MIYLPYIHKIVLLPDIVTLGTSNTGIARELRYQLKRLTL
jgi:hypothetical protein